MFKSPAGQLPNLDYGRREICLVIREKMRPIACKQTSAPHRSQPDEILPIDLELAHLRAERFVIQPQ